MKFTLLGPPAAGKGTQAVTLSERYGIPSISTGAIIRNAVRDATPFGVRAKEFMDSGGLVPDDIMIELVAERLKQDDCKNGYILDGFPRTVVQAKAVADMGIIFDKVISIEVPDDEIISRISGRRECKGCGAIYNLKSSPSSKGAYCEKCGAELIIRDDDREETVRKRLEVYHSLTEPLKEFYAQQNNLLTVIGMERVEDTTSQLFEALGA